MEGDHVATETPTFSWSPVDDTNVSNYIVWLYEVGGDGIWYRTVSKDITSVVFNDNNGAASALVQGGAYTWELQATDGEWNFSDDGGATFRVGPPITIYVDVRNAGFEDGSEENPYNTIQEGIDAALDGDTVLVMPGTYVENIGISKKDIMISSLFESDRNTDYIYQTVIDGSQGWAVVGIGESSEAVLSGFTVTNGEKGIDCYQANPILKNLRVLNNTAGGITADGANVTIENVVVADNQGYGIGCNNSTVNIVNVTIVDNVGTDGNSHGGLGIGGKANVALANTIVWNNTPNEIFFAPWLDQPNTLTISYSDIQFGQAGVAINDKGTVTWLDGNISENPGFSDPTKSDYRLQLNSPCIDAGNPDPINYKDVDGSRNDMGAYGGPGGESYTYTDGPPYVSNVIVNPALVYPGKDVSITCMIEDLTSSVIDSKKARIYSDDGRFMGVIDLFDDGQHNDGEADDHLFGGTWTTPDSEDNFSVTISVTDEMGYSATYENVGSFATQGLYDDFESGSIDPSKWGDEYEIVREIADGKLRLNVEGYDRQTTVEIHPKNQDFSYFQANVLLERGSYVANGADGAAAISGYFFNNGVDDIWIDVRLALSKDNQPYATAYIGNSSDTIVFLNEAFPTNIAFDTEYTLSIELTDTQVILGCNEDRQYFQITTPNNPPVDKRKRIMSRLYNHKEGEYGYIKARIDDVYINKDGVLYDDFESDLIDPTIWTDFEHIREVVDGQLRLGTRGVDERGNIYDALLASYTPYIGAKVMIETDSLLGAGTRGIARLSFYPYNDSRGPGSGLPYNGNEGDVWASIGLGHDEKNNLRAWVYAERYNFAEGWDEGTTLISEDFSVPIHFDQSYFLSIQLLGTEMVFRCEDEVKRYPILTPIFPPHNVHLPLTTRVYADPGESGFMAARYDDVQISTGAYKELVQITPTTLTVNEPAGAKTFTVKLTGTQPTANVTLDLHNTNPEACEISPSTLTFTPTNWETPQSVTVTAVDDALWDGDRSAVVITDALISGDDYYHGFEPSDVAVTIANDDTPHLTITQVIPNMGVTNESFQATIRGTEFTTGTQFSISDLQNPANRTEITTANVISATEATLTIPGQTTQGQYDLEAQKGTEIFKLEGAVSFAPFPKFNKKAIIVAGGGPYPGNALWNATKLVTHKAYWALSSQGYHPDQIQFLTHETFVDMDGDGANDRAGKATNANLQAALKTWARETVPGMTTQDPPEEILIFMSGHGGNGSFQIGIDEPLMAETLDEWMDALQEATSCNIIFIYDACISGSFLSELLPPDGFKDKRFLIASTAENQRAWFLSSGKHSFSYHFWDAVYAKGRLYGAYVNGKNFMQFDQTPRIDLTGDGESDAVTQSLLNNDIQIGRGRVAASSPPDIGGVSVSKTTLTCGENTATITADNVTAVNGVSSVFARIYPPGGARETDATKAGVAVPVKRLDGVGGDVFEGAWDDFSQDGLYRIAVFARDKSGVSCESVDTMVHRECESPATLTGDLNDDMDVDLTDMLIALKTLVGIDVADQIRLDYAISGIDVNGDDRAGFEEVVYALRETAGL